MAVDIPAHLHDLGVELDRLKVLYEQYFVGIEKQAPSVQRKEVEKHIQWLLMQNIGNTAVRFRFQTILRRWKLYAERWDRVLREIESGTFSPHVARAKRRLDAEQAQLRARRPPSSPALAKALGPDADPDAGTNPQASGAGAPAGSTDAPPGSDGVPRSPMTGDFSFSFTNVGQSPAGADLDDDIDKALSMLTESAAPSQPMAPSPSRPVRVAPPVERPPVPGMSEGELRALHQRYQQALKEQGDGRVVKFESLIDSLKKQVPTILTRSQCEQVSFDVALKEGKVVLKATPRRKKPGDGPDSK
jgi:hypothetical protein